MASSQSSRDPPRMFQKTERCDIMPLFDFKCEKCGKSMEILVRSSEEKAKCECGSEMKRQISAPSFEIVGNGWSKTDFKNKR